MEDYNNNKIMSKRKRNHQTIDVRKSRVSNSHYNKIEEEEIEGFLSSN